MTQKQKRSDPALKRNLVLLRTYIKECLQTLRHYPGRLRLSMEFLAFFQLWRRSLIDGRSPIADEIPWITFAAIKFLRSYIQKDMKVFEYGSGGSTLFFLKRAKQVASAEHDQDWLDKVSEQVANIGLTQLTHWVNHLIGPSPDEDFSSKDPENPFDYISSNQEYSGKEFKRYVKTIEAYPDAYFDIILIDGRARPSCFIHALKKINRSGVIVWDNTDRRRYHATMAMAPAQFEFMDFPGPSPYVSFFTRTSAWKRNDV